MLVSLDPQSPVAPEHRRLVDAFSHLKDVQLRQKWEVAEGIYLAESQNVIDRALDAGHEPQAFLLSPGWLDKLRPALLRATGDSDGGPLPVFLISEEATSDLTGFRVHRGALAAFRRPPALDPKALLDSFDTSRPRCVALLEGLVDHTNVGAVFRCAAALGIDAVFLNDTCADPLYRRSIRVSMGAVFQIPWARLHPWPGFDILHGFGYQACALTPAKDAIGLERFTATLPIGANIALYLGSEGPGLSKSTLSGADTRVKIPLAPSVDSLNVATAAAVAFWEARRHTRAV